MTAVRTTSRALHRRAPFLALLLLAAHFGAARAWAQDADAEAPAAEVPAAAAAASDGRSSTADYVIRARVDDAPPSDLDDGPQKTLSGDLELTWTNGSGEAVGDLWFHLYLNAYANNRSLHLTESKGRLRGRSIERGYGWQDVRKVTVDGVDVTESMRFRVPRGEAPFDRTLFSVDMPAPLASGASAEVRIEWESRLPRVRRRTGTKGNFILMSHWFPKLAVYEGGRGWRAHPFHMNTEFYADYGTYDVTLDLPAEYAGKVAGSGAQVGEPTLAGGRAVTRFLAPAEDDRATEDPSATGGPNRPLVHGFAWTADPDSFVYEETFHWGEWAARYEDAVEEAARAFGVEPGALAGRDVVVRVMCQPEREPQAKRMWRATAATLFFYGLWYGPYPYAEITAVDPAWGAEAAGGMEYPTLFTAGTRMFTGVDEHRPESVTVHEAGHQFWYGLVGNNEPEAAWLDEGFNSFSDAETLFREFGERRAATRYSRLPVWGVAPTPAPGGGAFADALSLKRIAVPNPLRLGLDRVGVSMPDGFGWLMPKSLVLSPLRVEGPLAYLRDVPHLTFVEERTDPRWGDRSGYLRDPASDPIETKVWDYVDRRSYSTNSYPRTAVALRSMQALVGRDAFLRGMRRFASDWRYRHPYPEDFYAAFQDGADAQLEWYFDAVFRGTDTVDWSCQVAQSRDPKAEGWFRCDDGSWDTNCAPDAAPPEESASGETAGDSSDEADDTDDERPWIYSVTLRKQGGLALPVKVRVTFADGEVEEHEWTREEQLTRNWTRLPLAARSERIASVIIDPEREWYFDADMSDNQWFDVPDRLAPRRWGERALTRSSWILQWFMSAGG